MSSKPKARTKRWQPGDLILLEGDAKVHSNLMEVLDIQEHRAKAVYLEPRSVTKAQAAGEERGEDDWHSVGELRDPAMYLKTEEFLRTLQERSRRKLKA